MYHMYMSMCSFNKRRLSSIIPPISLFSQILCAKRFWNMTIFDGYIALDGSVPSCFPCEPYKAQQKHPISPNII